MMTTKITQTPQHCLIYCRVSSKRQVEEGTGLDSQEKLCQNRADAKGYVVEEVFRDDGISGALFDRPAMMRLIAYLDAHPYRQYVVIFDDLKRFARDYSVHLKIKSELMARDVTLECLNFTFENSPENGFIEGVLALHGELERKQNQRQVIQKQRARLERGFWPFCPPLGFKHSKSKRDGKVLVLRQPYATIFKEAIEGYEKNVFVTQEQVRQFIAKEYRKHGIKRNISLHGVQETLKNPLYAGYIEYTKWDVSRREGHHKGFISPETFQRVQDKLAGRTKVRLRKDYTLDFPLRGWAVCAGCGHPFTASWVSGRSKRYPTYVCNQDGCQYQYKSIQKSKIEPEFETILSTKKVGHDMGDLVKAIFQDAWETQKQETALEYEQHEEHIASLDTQIENLTIRVSLAKTQLLAEAYEAQIEKLAQEKETLVSKTQPQQFSEKQFGTALNRVLVTLENPLVLWKSDYVEDRRTIQFMYFDTPPQYSYKSGFGTMEFGEAINLFSSFSTTNTPSVEMGGSEPPSVTASSISSTDIEHSCYCVSGRSAQAGAHNPYQRLARERYETHAVTLTGLSPIARHQ